MDYITLTIPSPFIGFTLKAFVLPDDTIVIFKRREDVIGTYHHPGAFSSLVNAYETLPLSKCYKRAWLSHPSYPAKSVDVRALTGPSEEVVKILLQEQKRVYVIPDLRTPPCEH